LPYLPLNINYPSINQIANSNLSQLMKISETIAKERYGWTFLKKYNLSQEYYHPLDQESVSFSRRAASDDIRLISGYRSIYLSFINQAQRVVSAKNRFIILEKLIFNQKKFLVERIMGHYRDVEAGILMGVIFGDTTTLPPNLKHNLKVTGMQHIASASGYNVSLVSMLVMLVLPRLSRSTLVQNVGLCTAVGWYLTISGVSAPLLRAVVMSYLSVLTRMSLHQYRPLWGLLVTAILLLVIDGSFISSVSFQLSMAATFGIISLMPLLENQASTLTALSQNDIDFFGQSNSSLFNFFKESFLVSLAAQSFTLPLVLYHFHELSTLSLLANTALLWCVSLITIGGVVFLLVASAAAAAPILLPMVWMVGLAVKILLNTFIYGLNWLGQFESSLLTVQITLWQLIWCWVLLIIWVIWRQFARNSWQKLTY
jgi:ComEC/Rec2-related protein